VAITVLWQPGTVAITSAAPSVVFPLELPVGSVCGALIGNAATLVPEVSFADSFNTPALFTPLTWSAASNQVQGKVSLFSIEQHAQASQYGITFGGLLAGTYVAMPFVFGGCRSDAMGPLDPPGFSRAMTTATSAAMSIPAIIPGVPDCLQVAFALTVGQVPNWTGGLVSAPNVAPSWHMAMRQLANETSVSATATFPVSNTWLAGHFLLAPAPEPVRRRQHQMITPHQPWPRT
jgi:hypothetical protein